MVLAEHERVQLIWVPGYKGIAANETTNWLAKWDAQTPFIGLEPPCCILVKL
jgi:hypothetical protein